MTMTVSQRMNPARLRAQYYIHRGGFFVLLFTIILSIGWAVLFATADEQLNTIPTAYLIALFGQRPGAVIVLLGTAVLAAFGLRRPGMNLSGAGMMIPQVFVLFLSAYSALFSALVGHYPDGTVPLEPHLFIATDHLLTILFAFLHAACVAVYHGGGRWISPES